MNIIQLTDFHLFANPTENLHGYCTYEGLVSVINAIVKKNQLHAEAVFITGDISEDRSTRSYELALRQIERLGLPVYYLAGNHDNEECLRSIFNRSHLVSDKREIIFDDWVIIKLNTVLTGKDSGFLNPAEKEVLEGSIAKYPTSKIALFMHHHPLPVGIPIVDDCFLMNPETILNLCCTPSPIESIICGHAHTSFTHKYHNTIVDVCPATCFQWQMGAQTLITENWRGYKLLSFDQDYHSQTFFV